MTQLQFSNDPAVQQAIADATAEACRVLDDRFPGWDAGGITSNFQGLLAETITHMLKGRSVLDGVRGHATFLPRLIVDDSFFGCPLIRGEMFLIHKPEKPVYGEPDRVLVLDPDSSRFKPISTVGDAFTSFEHAAAAAMKYLEAEGLTLEQAKELKLEVVPVVFDPCSTSDRGFKIVSPHKAA
jgi:hypothetical protein